MSEKPVAWSWKAQKSFTKEGKNNEREENGIFSTPLAGGFLVVENPAPKRNNPMTVAREKTLRF